MTESKSVATDRLRREQRWEEASLWRDQKRKELRAEGRSRVDANEEAWLAMIEAFPPIPEDSPDEMSEAVELTELGSYAGQPDLSRDVQWVYEHLARKDVTAKDAPSLGAWDLLQWARKNRNRFFEQVLPKAMAAIEKVAVEESPYLEDPGIKDIDKMLADIQLEWERGAVTDMDATIQLTVKDRMSDWERRYDLDLAVDARESWGRLMVSLVNEAVAAVTKHGAASEAD